MPNIDAFSKQLVALVRTMPDEAVPAFVTSQLDGIAVLSTSMSATRTPSRRRAAAKTARTARNPAAAKSSATMRKAARKPAATRGNKAALLLSVEKVVTASKGVSLADVAKATGTAKARAAAALRQLKQARRIAQGGDRRFARYAGDRKTAVAASERARGGVVGVHPERRHAVTRPRAAS